MATGDKIQYPQRKGYTKDQRGPEGREERVREGGGRGGRSMRWDDRF